MPDMPPIAMYSMLLALASVAMLGGVAVLRFVPLFTDGISPYWVVVTRLCLNAIAFLLYLAFCLWFVLALCFA